MRRNEEVPCRVRLKQTLRARHFIGVPPINFARAGRNSLRGTRRENGVINDDGMAGLRITALNSPPAKANQILMSMCGQGHYWLFRMALVGDGGGSQ